MKLIDPNELEKVLRPILTDESCPLHIAAEIDMNLDLMPKVDAVPREIEQANKQAAYVRGYEDGQKDKYGRWGDAIEVVRCRDCKFYHQMTAETGICKLACRHLGNDGFCSEGERKGGEQA